MALGLPALASYLAGCNSRSPLTYLTRYRKLTTRLFTALRRPNTDVRTLPLITIASTAVRAPHSHLTEPDIDMLIRTESSHNVQCQIWN